METLHTSGDWYAKDGQIVAQDTGKTLAVIPYYDSEEEQVANANLMAAAPELLKALKLLLKSHCRVRSDDSLESTPVERLAEQAIQQATNP